MSKKINRVKPCTHIFILLVIFCVMFQQAIPAQAYSNTVRNNMHTISGAKPTLLSSIKTISNYKLNYKKYKLVKGKSFTLKVTKLPSKYRVTYKSNNSKIATVTSKGRVTGVKHGMVTITATVRYNNRILRKLTCNVTVGPAAVSVVIPESNIILTVSEKKDLNPIIKPKTSTESPRFSSSNSRVVTVTSSGIIQGIKKGTAVITVTIGNNKSDQCVVTVKDTPKQNNNTINYSSSKTKVKK